MLSVQHRVAYFFATGNCSGCSFYEEHTDCHTGKCDVHRHCHLLEIGVDLNRCKQLQEDNQKNPTLS